MEKIFKVEIKRTPQSVVDAIRFFEMEFGESYLEYNDIFSDPKELMDYSLEKGYITKEKYLNWKVDYDNNSYDAGECFNLLFGEDEELEPHCIRYEDEESEESYDAQYGKALLVYGELICSKETYFDKFVEEFSSGEGNLGYVEVIKIKQDK